MGALVVVHGVWCQATPGRAQSAVSVLPAETGHEGRALGVRVAEKDSGKADLRAVRTLAEGRILVVCARRHREVHVEILPGDDHQ
jgi:hypothetical protein